MHLHLKTELGVLSRTRHKLWNLKFGNLKWITVTISVLLHVFIIPIGYYQHCYCSTLYLQLQYCIAGNFCGVKNSFFVASWPWRKILPTKTYRSAPNAVHVVMLTKFLLTSHETHRCSSSTNFLPRENYPLYGSEYLWRSLDRMPPVNSL